MERGSAVTTGSPARTTATISCWGVYQCVCMRMCVLGDGGTNVPFKLATGSPARTAFNTSCGLCIRHGFCCA